MTTTQTLRYTTGGRFVLDNGRVIERHRTPELAQDSARRLNSQCVKCHRAGGLHEPGCPLALFERDDAFGSEYDDNDE